MENELAIYRFHWDCGRMGEVGGTFCATPVQVADIYGKEIYLGEVLGKHSEVHGTIDEADIKLITDDPEVVAMFNKHGLAQGFNPLEYYEPSEE